MHELSTELARFIGGGISLDELRGVFRNYLAQHREQRDAISHWLRNTVEEGRLSATIWLSLRDLFEDPPAGRSLTEIVGHGASHFAADPARTQAAFAGAGAPTARTAIASRSAAPQIVPEGATLRPGMVVRERFVLVEQLGRGGMGEVFKARDLRREEAQDRQPFIALKILNKEVSAHPDSFIALQREARRASTLAHPNVVTVYDFDRDGSRIYMTMEYLEGRALDVLMREEWAEGLPLEKAWPVVRGVALALEYGHEKRIVHSDLKPANIFVCRDGTVKVLDFGIARLINPTETNAQHTVFDPGKRLGGLTPAYAALEMWNREAPDPRDDVYALACVTYELLSGRHPFDRLSARTADKRKLAPARIEGLSRAQWDSLRKGLELHRGQRTATVTEFIKAFAPQSRLKKYALPTAVGAVLATAAMIAVGARYYRDVVEDSTLQVLQCAQIPKPATTGAERAGSPPTVEQQRHIEDSLLLAQDFMRDVTPETGVEDLKYILSDGANSVTDILASILTIDPGQSQALRLQADVAALYSDRARQLLAQHKPVEALDLVRYSRRILPASQELFRLEQEVCRANATARPAG